MKYVLILVVVFTGIGMWWFRAGLALRNCYIDQVELQQVKANKFTGVLSSGLATEKQIQLNDLVIDSYPECDKQIAEEFRMPSFGMNIIAAQASD
jgi:hypothetical protein